MTKLKHLAIIMDGNGRWAQSHHRPRVFGHIKGTRVAKKIITACVERKIEALTLYAFSSENWLRPESEVSFLMSLLRKYLVRERNNLIQQNIKFSVIGKLSKLPKEVLDVIHSTIEATSHCTGMNLVFALSYGSRQEITSAVQEIAQMIEKGSIKSTDVDESLINSLLATYPLPDPDLIIRTSGEMRLSNFLMWQASYSEFYFSDVLWPDFTEKDLDKAILNFMQRQRRYGKVTSNEILNN